MANSTSFKNQVIDIGERKKFGMVYELEIFVCTSPL